MKRFRDSFQNADMLMKLIYINVTVFILVNIVLVVAQLSNNSGFILNHGEDLYLASTSNTTLLLSRPWSIITYMFTHIDFWHMFFNMLILFIFGRIFNSFLGQRKLLSIYLMGGVAGFLLYIISFNVLPALDPDSTIVGASAAIMAIVVALGVYVPNYTINLLLIGPIKMQYIALFYVVLDFVSLRFMDNTGGHIGHLGGAILGLVWAWNYKVNKDISLPVERFLDWFFNLFKPGKRKFKVVKNAGTRVPKSDENFNADKKQRQQRVDAILDKISKAGYDSLSKEEKDFLFKHSKS